MNQAQPTNSTRMNCRAHDSRTFKRTCTRFCMKMHLAYTRICRPFFLFFIFQQYEQRKARLNDFASIQSRAGARGGEGSCALAIACLVHIKAFIYGVSLRRASQNHHVICSILILRWRGPISLIRQLASSDWRATVANATKLYDRRLNIRITRRCYRHLRIYIHTLVCLNTWMCIVIQIPDSERWALMLDSRGTELMAMLSFDFLVCIFGWHVSF